MKASEMTNEELANFFEINASTVLRCTRCGDETPISDFFASRFREAAARLRNQDCKNCEISKSEMRFRYERDAFEKKCREAYIAQGKVIDETASQNVSLRAKLKVAEDALEKCKNAMCNYCRSTPVAKGLPCLNGCETLAIAKNALAAIREEGGSNAVD